VNTHVPFQFTGLTKTLLANITFVRFLFRVRTPVSGQTGWISKHLLANIALVPSLFLRSFPNSYLFFSFFFLYLMMTRLEIIILVRNPQQTQHQIWFFFFLNFFFIFSRNLQNRPRVVHRAFSAWILSSSRSVTRIRMRDFRREEEVDEYGAHV
jgi:hypothetical protein